MKRQTLRKLQEAYLNGHTSDIFAHGDYTELDEGIRSAISRLLGRKSPPSRGEQLRAKYGDDIRGNRNRRTVELYGRNSEQARRVSKAGESLRGIRSRDTTSTHDWLGRGNAAQRRAGRIPSPQTIDSIDRASQFKGKAGQKPMDIPFNSPVFVSRQDMPLATQRAARGRKKSLATGKRLGEDYLYDLILEYLLYEGYADCLGSAEIILENMSDEWLDSIIG